MTQRGPITAQTAANPATLGYFIGGTATQPADIPSSGLRSLRTFVAFDRQTPGGDPVFLFVNDAQLQLNFTAGTLTGSGRLSSSDPNLGLLVTIEFDGQLNRQTGRLAGSVRGSDGLTGTFQGRLFGPTGSEIGLTFETTRGAERGVGLGAGKPG